jgi:hypothetical protein
MSLSEEDLARIESSWPCDDVRLLTAEVRRLQSREASLQRTLTVYDEMVTGMDAPDARAAQESLGFSDLVQMQRETIRDCVIEIREALGDAK